MSILQYKTFRRRIEALKRILEGAILNIGTTGQTTWDVSPKMQRKFLGVQSLSVKDAVLACEATQAAGLHSKEFDSPSTASACHVTHEMPSDWTKQGLRKSKTCLWCGGQWHQNKEHCPACKVIHSKCHKPGTSLPLYCTVVANRSKEQELVAAAVRCNTHAHRAPTVQVFATLLNWASEVPALLDKGDDVGATKSTFF